MSRIRVIPIILLLQLIVACGGDSSEIISVDPSNLVLDVVVSTDGSGLITLTAKADNAVEFQFYNGDTDDVESNATGSFQYSYVRPGTYTIEVRAIGSAGRFIKETQQVTIDFGTIEGPYEGADGYVSANAYEGMSLTWQDEFSGNALNTSDWNYETGTGSNGWGNWELQYYKQENLTLSSGYLKIQAKKESFGGSSYTSSRITTQNKFNFQYGRIDIRAKMPVGQGMWPALWMLGSNISTVGWPSCGEIDIMEMIGGGDGRDNVVHGTVHWSHNNSHASYGGKKQIDTGILNDKFHVYSIIWTDSSIDWYLDDVKYHSTSITGADQTEFKAKYFLIFNVAVGGLWPGSPDASTSFPQEMLVDYVRVFQ